MHILQFHRTVHGCSVHVSPDGLCVRRDPSAYSGGIAFSSQPLRPEQRVCLEISTTTLWSGAIRVGVTCHNPNALNPSDLPRFLCPDLSGREGFWARALSERNAQAGNRVAFSLNTSGQMHYYVNNEHKGLLLNHLPTYTSLWLVLDIYGNTVAAKLVPADEAPVEILARGPEAIDAYHSACRSGTKPVFRTRLMLVGQDRVGKTSLKHALTGQRHNTAELSTDGIDLSASCSFNLNDQKVWKLALAGQNTADTSTAPLHIHTDTIETLEEEANRAIATNIVLELLQQRRMLKEDGGSKGRDLMPSPETEKKDEDEDSNVEQQWLLGNHSTPDLSTNSFLENLSSHQLLKNVSASVTKLVHSILAQTEQAEATNPSGIHSNRDVTLNIWDFAGQAAYYTLHQVFLSYRAVYVIVFNLTHDLEAVAESQLQQPASSSSQQTESKHDEETNLSYMDYWMNLIHTHTARSKKVQDQNATHCGSLSPPVFIVGTHRANLANTPEDQHRLAAQKFDQIRRYFSTRPYEKHVVPQFYAVENTFGPLQDSSIRDLQKHIEEVAGLENYMGEQIPSKWLKFEQQINMLVDLGCNFTSVEQMHEVAYESGVTSRAEFHTLLQFYHDLGVIVHFGGLGTLDNLLRHTVVLNPQWLIDMFKRIICPPLEPQGEEKELWQKLVITGVLEEKLIDLIWKEETNEKPALLGLMQKFDLICEKLSTRNISLHVSRREGESQTRSYYIPCCLCSSTAAKKLYTQTEQDVVFYFDFNGFLPDGLFHRVLTRAIRWSQDCGGHEPHLQYRSAKFYLDSEHDYVLEMAPSRLARIKVSVLRVVDLEETDDNSSDSEEDQPMPPPSPTACAKVRKFLESSLSELREMWMRRIHYKATVQCSCDKECVLHQREQCQEADCIHFLLLDECLSNKVVCCDHRRVKTAQFRKWFPSLLQIGTNPSGQEYDRDTDKFTGVTDSKDTSLPGWARSAAKLLNGGSEGQDWSALAKKLGYKKNKIEKFGNELNPGLGLLTDWIVTSGNTTLSVDMLISYLKQMYRDDIVEIIQCGQISDSEPPQVFISYQWDSQDEVKVLRDRLEKAGISCWMDIGQMGGGDQLYARVDQGIRQAKVFVACVSPKFVVSHYCNKEVSLADLLGKPIIPVLYEQLPWPPPGSMALVFSQLIYINMKGIGGHGGSGLHADLESKYQEVIGRVSSHVTPKYHKPFHLTPNYDKKRENFTDSNSPPHSPTPPQNPYIISGYPNQVLPLQRRSGSLEMIRAPARNEEQNTPPNYSNTVEQVHVAKCAVCTIL